MSRLDNKADILWVLLFAMGYFGVFFLYLKGASGPFLLDDSELLSAYEAFGGVTDLNSLRHFVFDFGPTALGRPISFLSFLLNDQFAPASAEAFKLTNIYIHVLIGIVLCAVLLLLGQEVYGESVRIRYIALILTFLWLVMPIHTSTVFYVIQRMTQLAVLFTLSAIWFYHYALLKCQSDLARLCSYVAAAISICLAVLSKESGALVFLYLFVLHRFFFQEKSRPLVSRAALWLLVYLPSAMLLAYLALSFSKFSASYAYRDFTMPERLLTETRILWDYIYHILVPRLSGLGVFHDDYVLSSSLFSPGTTALALFGHLLLVCAAWALRNRSPLISLGIAWFYCSHLLESTIIPLELYFEHRNYLASVGVLLFCTGVFMLVMEQIEEWFLKPLHYLVAGLMFFFSAMMTSQAALTWSDQEMLFSSWAMENENSKRAQRNWLRIIYEEKNYIRAYEYSVELAETFPQDLGFKLSAISAGCRADQDIDPILRNIIYPPMKLVAHENAITGLLHLEELILNDVCDSLDIAQLHVLYDAIRQIEHRRGNWKATLYAYEAELYVKQRNLPGALTALDESIKLKRTAEKYMRQAALMLSAGLTDLAEERYQLAVEANNKRRHFEADMSSTLKDLKLLILSAKEQ